MDETDRRKIAAIQAQLEQAGHTDAKARAIFMYNELKDCCMKNNQMSVYPSHGGEISQQTKDKFEKTINYWLNDIVKMIESLKRETDFSRVDPHWIGHLGSIMEKSAKELYILEQMIIKDAREQGY